MNNIVKTCTKQRLNCFTPVYDCATLNDSLSAVLIDYGLYTDCIYLYVNCRYSNAVPTITSITLTYFYLKARLLTIVLTVSSTKELNY